MERDIVIIGVGGFAKEILFLLERNNEDYKQWNILGFVDNTLPPKTEILGYSVLGNDEWLIAQKREICVVCAVGNPKLKAKILAKFLDKENLSFPNLIDNSVIISKHVKLGKGCIICAGSILTVNITFFDFVTINLDCTIGHDSRIGAYTTVYPGVHISGNVEIGSLSEIGTGSQIIQGIKIYDKVIVGAGSVLIRNIDNSCTVVGNPARIVK